MHSVIWSFLLIKALLDRIHHLGKCFLNPQLYLSISVSHRCIFHLSSCFLFVVWGLFFPVFIAAVSLYQYLHGIREERVLISIWFFHKLQSFGPLCVLSLLPEDYFALLANWITLERIPERDKSQWCKYFREKIRMRTEFAAAAQI